MSEAIPTEAIDAAAQALDGWHWKDHPGDQRRDLIRMMLAAAAPVLVADCLKAAGRGQFEGIIAAATEEATGARLAEIEAAVRASERERIRQIANKAEAVYLEFCDRKPWCTHGDHMRPFADLLDDEDAADADAAMAEPGASIPLETLEAEENGR